MTILTSLASRPVLEDFLQLFCLWASFSIPRNGLGQAQVPMDTGLSQHHFSGEARIMMSNVSPKMPEFSIIIRRTEAFFSGSV